MNDEEDGCSELSRSCTPESLTSTGTGQLDHTECYSDGEEDLCLDESLEQTIACDLEKLTDSGSTVNQLEIQQQQAWREYVRVKEEGLKNLQALKKKLQSSIDKTEPFVTVWRRARKLQEEAHSAAIKFERAHSEHESAKETLRIAEEGIANLERERRKDSNEGRAKSPGFQIDEAWQETLANATERVEKTSQTRLESEIEHRRLTVEFQKCQVDYKGMENRCKRSIKKSRPYYEARYKCNQRLIELKKKIQELDNRLSQHKKMYKSTMRHLESLNYLLHEHKERRRASSVMETSSEPNLLQERSRTPDFPLMLQRMAFTPDVRKKNMATNIGFELKGSTGSLPSVEPSKVTANIVVTSSSPEQKLEVSTVVSTSLARALERMDQDGKGSVDQDQCPVIIIQSDKSEQGLVTSEMESREVCVRSRSDLKDDGATEEVNIGTHLGVNGDVPVLGDECDNDECDSSHSNKVKPTGEGCSVVVTDLRQGSRSLQRPEISTVVSTSLARAMQRVDQDKGNKGNANLLLNGGSSRGEERAKDHLLSNEVPVSVPVNSTVVTPPTEQEVTPPTKQEATTPHTKHEPALDNHVEVAPPTDNEDVTSPTKQTTKTSPGLSTRYAITY